MEKATTTKEQEIIDNIDRAINELVYEKTSFIKAYNYYHGKRDPEQFRHLEENYGIGTPTSVEFVPLVKKHIDALIGEYLSIPVMPKISCKDKETLSNIYRDKQISINKAVAAELKSHLNNMVSAVMSNSQQPTDIEVQARLQTAMELADKNFISEYEIAAQNIVQHSLQSRSIDFTNKRKLLLTDLLVSGTCYYKTCPTSSNSGVNLKILNPINTFIDRNPESPYLKHSARAVHREYLTKHQILSRYGEYLSKEDLDILEGMEAYSQDGSTTTYLRSYDNVTGNNITDGILGGFEVTPLLPFERNTSKYFRLFPVHEVEWLQTDKENGEYISNRYEGVRIGTSIYIPIGKVENVWRSQEDPKHCSLSINGMFYSDRNGDPYSLILATANLQDKYDVLNFYRDNIIAESGTAGDWIDIAYLPKILGSNLAERLMKWKAYKKQGVAIIDSSQEGLPPMNTTFGGFDDTLKLQAIQAIELAIQRIEDTASNITGVFKEKIGGIEQRDAVTNVQVGVRQSTYVTKQYYQLMDLMTREILLDILDLSKVVYKNGYSGLLVLGDNLNKIFTALPEHYTITDFDINIVDSTEITLEMETIKQLGFEFAKSNSVDPEIILEVTTAKGLTKMKADVINALNKKKNEGNQLGQLSQQVEQLNSQLKQATSEASKLQQQVNQLNAEKLELERKKLEFEKELGWYQARSDNRYKESSLELEKDRVRLEGAQLLDNNSNNDEIRNN